MNFKLERIKKGIIQEIMKAIANHELKDPRIPEIITITKASLSKDLHYCHLYFSVLGDEKERDRTLAGLNNARGYFQKIISERLAIRFTPKIEFKYDKDEENAYHIDKLLDNLSKDREKD